MYVHVDYVYNKYSIHFLPAWSCYTWGTIKYSHSFDNELRIYFIKVFTLGLIFPPTPSFFHRQHHDKSLAHYLKYLCTYIFYLHSFRFGIARGIKNCRVHCRLGKLNCLSSIKHCVRISMPRPSCKYICIYVCIVAICIYTAHATVHKASGTANIAKEMCTNCTCK